MADLAGGVAALAKGLAFLGKVAIFHGLNQEETNWMQKELRVPDIYSGVFRCKMCGQEVVGRFVRELPVCPRCGERHWETVHGGKKVCERAIVLESSET